MTNSPNPTPSNGIALDVCGSLYDKIFDVNASLAFLHFILSEYFEYNKELSLDERNGFSVIFTGLNDKLESCKNSVELLTRYIRAAKAREEEGRE